MKILEVRTFTRIAVLLATGIGAAAGTIVVSGDSNIGNGLDGSGLVPVTAGNATFFSNLLGAGTNVLIETTTNVDGTVNSSQAAIIAFYTAMAGVNVTTTTAATSANLAGENLFISVLHDAAFSGAETTAIGDFLTGGGTALFTGDGATFDGAGDNSINAALTALGSPLQLNLASYDPLLHVATGGNIVAGPLTAGITSFGYAFTTGVTGGNPVFLTSGGTPAFLETSAASVSSTPEPTTFALVAGAGIGLVALRRRRAAK